VDDRVLLIDLRLRGSHGLGADERAQPQEFAVTIECPTDAARAAAADAIDDALDYRRLRTIAAEVIGGPPRHLLETLADEIARRILAAVAPSWARVRVTKLAPPGFEGAAAVEVWRESGSSGIPIAVELHVPDFAPVRDFYRQLGFSVVRDDPGPDGYLVLRYEETAIAFWPGSEAERTHHFFSRHPAGTPRGLGVEIIITTTELKAMYGRAKALGAVVEPLRMRKWGARDFRIADPFGFYLRITETQGRQSPSRGTQQSGDGPSPPE
jgi:dihydroneopterin aldolase